MAGRYCALLLISLLVVDKYLITELLTFLRKGKKTKKNCYDWLIKRGFGKTKVQSCVDNPETISLFFKWKAKNTIDNQLANGQLSSKYMKPCFIQS